MYTILYIAASETRLLIEYSMYSLTLRLDLISAAPENARILVYEADVCHDVCVCNDCRISSCRVYSAPAGWKTYHSVFNS